MAHAQTAFGKNRTGGPGLAMARARVFGSAGANEMPACELYHIHVVPVILIRACITTVI